ncbi:MAG: glycosyltransferase [Hyphomonas sp.]
MKVSIQTLGSLGDVMPYIATAKRLRGLGADVSILAPRDYTDIIRAHGIAAAAPPDFSLETWNREAEERGTLTNPLKFLRDWQEMVVPYVADITDRCLAAADGADVILANGICAPARLAAERNRIPYLLHALQPVISPTSDIPCAMVWRPWHGDAFNRLGYGTVWAAQRFMEQALKTHRRQLRLTDMPPLSHTQTHLGQPLPRITSTSPALIANRPTDWKANDHLLAYPSLDSASAASLPAEIRRFAESGPPPIFVSLGSLESDTPAPLLAAVFAALEARGVRTIVSEGLAARLTPEQAATVCLVGHVPHAALLPICGGILHHGGAGTTDSALRAGIPQIIFPQRLDQFWHARRMADIGVAPAPLSQRAGDTSAVRNALDFVHRPDVWKRAKELSASLLNRDGALELAGLIISETARFQQNAK